jgi:phosphatidylserine decarboxylase
MAYTCARLRRLHDGFDGRAGNTYINADRGRSIVLLPPYVTSALAPIHPAGWPFIAGGLVLSLVLGQLWTPLFWLGLLVTAWVAYFFRDPARVTPEGEGIVVSPADGVVQAIAPRRPPPELELGDAPLTCISVFLNILDVHVNRAPVGGRITRLVYHPGKFLNAADDKASESNERQSFRIETEQGQVFGLVQIAGLIARRIVRFVEQGEVVQAGQRVGLIRFGSRCDVYLPDGMAPQVLVGQRAIGGETVLADGRRNQAASGGRRS